MDKPWEDSQFKLYHKILINDYAVNVSYRAYDDPEVFYKYLVVTLRAIFNARIKDVTNPDYPLEQIYTQIARERFGRQFIVPFAHVSKFVRMVSDMLEIVLECETSKLIMHAKQ